MIATSSDSSDLYTTIRTSWDAEAATYDEPPSHGLQSKRLYWAWRRLLGRAFGQPAGERPVRVVDVGAGSGTISAMLADMGYTVTGVDLSPAMLALAREKAERLGVPLTLLEGTADALPLPDASADVVFARHLLWTLPDPLAALREWARVVRPGGLVAVADGWWDEPAREMRLRRAIGKVLRGVLERDKDWLDGYATIRDQLPLAGGVSPYSVRYWLSSADLERIRVRDLKTIRAAERRSLPPWRWIDQPRSTWLATGYRPT